MSSQQPTRQRYNVNTSDKGSWSSKLIAIFMVVIVAAFALAFVRYMQAQGKATVQAETATVEIIDDQTFLLGIDVTRTTTAEPTYCIVTALNYDKAEVGRREVLIPAGGNKLERVFTRIATTEQAVSGDVYGCSNIIPFYLTEAVELN
ncbi:putative secreted protein [Corynebacterium kutscheri]|uniref:Secreted protein n=1 Tax=Corynebacterium kutscheri TaxID=35755 RepID=A0A0F6R2P7_9CORY|nr:DUF4307 domain-containing protein [Corynebacterium kutscheri]AKE41778.1 protein of unknown function (DUF4307) [Corynebacterium kutscheri]VEH09053.1 putative secreted protein [Corynebacterium kutscheri]VEH10104.1 putative secreted protein [Corynebacterium kutscheri]VEH80186.1 putative secreted protein [Corynebacterium kutscheri]